MVVATVVVVSTATVVAATATKHSIASKIPRQYDGVFFNNVLGTLV